MEFQATTKDGNILSFDLQVEFSSEEIVANENY